jgi:hypothetical protein
MNERPRPDNYLVILAYIALMSGVIILLAVMR